MHNMDAKSQIFVYGYGTPLLYFNTDVWIM